jgi:hypothetical protein
MACDGTFDAPHIEVDYAKNVTGTTGFLSQIAETKPAPERAPASSVPEDERRLTDRQELAFSTVTARRFCDQQEMSLQTATGRSLP